MAKKKGKKVAGKKTAAGAKGAPLTLHGAPLSVGDVKKAVRGKASVVTILPRKSIRVVKGFNPRATLGDTETLAGSIKREGLINPLTVRPTKGKPGMFDLVAGERRLVAADSLKMKELPVQIRMDLEGDDVRARAVAVAENSPDGRSNLNPVEIGGVLKDLADANWAVSRIAQETALHAQKVRRCLTLVSAPKDVRERVRSGELGMMAGLELAKADPGVRKKVGPLLPDRPSAEEVRRQVKKAAKPAGKAKPGKTAKHQKGEARDASVAAWKGSKEKQKMIRELSDMVVNIDKESEGTVSYHEARGAVASLLWDRGDLDSPLAPSVDPKEEDDVAAAKKALKAFNVLLGAEAAKHKPEA